MRGQSLATHSCLETPSCYKQDAEQLQRCPVWSSGMLGPTIKTHCTKSRADRRCCKASQYVAALRHHLTQQDAEQLQRCQIWSSGMLGPDNTDTLYKEQSRQTLLQRRIEGKEQPPWCRNQRRVYTCC